MMNLFLDAQIWLSIYDFSNDNLETFNKLNGLVGKDVSIYLPQQAQDEVKRNRENKIKEALTKFEKINFQIQIPNLCKGYGEFETFQKMLEDVRTLHSEFIKKIKSDITANNLHSDILISEIFKNCKILSRTDDIIKKAKLRYDIGNPPGKDKSYGDAINWESLLENIPTGEDLFFIGSDKDYNSVLDRTRFNQYLFDEWKDTKKSNLFYYNTLTEYFNLHLKHIELETEAQKNDLIEQLGKCDAFRATHTIIAKLSAFSTYSDEQITQLLLAAAINDQVWQIINDPDIKSFYDALLKDNVDRFSKNAELNWVLNKLGYSTE